jgi:hypothetical protein
MEKDETILKEAEEEAKRIKAAEATPVEDVAPSPTPALEEPKKKSNLPIILIVLLVLIAGGFAVWYFVLGGNDKKSSKNEEPKQEEKKEDKTNTEIEEKINLSEEEIKTQINDIYHKLFTNESMGMFDGLDNKKKLALVLDKLEFENPHASEGESYNNLSDISIDEVKKAYYDVYGEELTDFISTEAISHCSYYRYDEEINRYIRSDSACGGAIGWYIVDYIYNYEIIGNEAFLYTSIAVFDGLDGHHVFTDNDCRDSVDYTYKDECLFTINENSQFKLDETNYQSFAKYKISFERQNDNYYLKKVEKIENGKGNNN